MKNNRRVYCKNCKHYFYDFIRHICEKLSEIKRNGIGDLVYVTKADAYKFNIDCNCSFYERKWYKFWIKE